jgi:hypothetical protein
MLVIQLRHEAGMTAFASGADSSMWGSCKVLNCQEVSLCYYPCKANPLHTVRLLVFPTEYVIC